MVIIILRFHCKLGIHMCIIPHSIAYKHIRNIKRTHTSVSTFLGLPCCSYFSTCVILSKQTEEHMIQGSQAGGLD